MSGARRVTVSVVTHNSARVIGRALASVADAAAVVAVDNASRDETAAAILAARPDARVLGPGGNLGFGAGHNAGLAETRTEFVLLLNPDAALKPGALDALVAAADRYPNAALLGPAIYRADGRLETSHDLGLFERIAAGPRRDEAEPPAGDLSANFLSGAVLLGRVAALREIGGFDPAFFLYFEDDDLCLRLRRAGWTLVRVAAAAAEHAGGASSAPSAAMDRLKWTSFGWSRLAFEAKHRERAAARVTMFRLMLRHALRALGDGLIGRTGKRDRHLWTLSGMIAFARGRSAREAAGLTTPDAEPKSASS